MTSKGQQITKIHRVKNVEMEIIANYVSMFIDLVEEGPMQIAIPIIWSPRKVRGNQKVVGYMRVLKVKKEVKTKGRIKFQLHI